MLKPLSAGKWDFTMAAHLLNRAAFGGTPAEIEKLASLGPEQAVSSLVDFEKTPDPSTDPSWAHPDAGRAERRRIIRNATPDQRQQLQKQENMMLRDDMLELRGWWLDRMASGPRPFQEKMVLFW